MASDKSPTGQNVRSIKETLDVMSDTLNAIATSVFALSTSVANIERELTHRDH